MISQANIDLTTLDRIKAGLAAVSFPELGGDQGALLNRSWKASMNRQVQKLLNEFRRRLSLYSECWEPSVVGSTRRIG